MYDTLIIYSSTDGHTKTICERISNFLNSGNQIKLISLAETTNFDLSDPSSFKSVISLKTLTLLKC